MISLFSGNRQLRVRLETVYLAEIEIFFAESTLNKVKR